MAKQSESQEREPAVTVMAYMPVSLRDQAKQLAKRDDTSLSSVVRRAVRQLVEAQDA